MKQNNTQAYEISVGDLLIAKYTNSSRMTPV
jgi:hypothetical protein